MRSPLTKSLPVSFSQNSDFHPHSGSSGILHGDEQLAEISTSN